MTPEPETIETYRLRDLVELLVIFDPEELLGSASELQIEDQDALYVLTREEANDFLRFAAHDVRRTFRTMQG
jgi:hypothetical protein